MLSFKTPTKEQIDAAVQRMRSSEFMAYFLSRLENPRWIPALRQKGLFASPPPSVTVEGGGVRYPHWPASDYLARMAPHSPSEVAAVFVNIKTENASIIGDMLNAALAMPAREAATLVPTLCQATQGGALWFKFKDASQLCASLAESDEVSAATALAEALFKPHIEDGKEEPRRQDLYWYKDGLEKVTPVLAERDSHKFLPMMCDWLKAAVHARKYVDPETGSDHSHHWRPAIEEHNQNRDYEFAGVIVGFVREGFEQAIRLNKVSLDGALEIVDRHHYLVFKRLRLHLINEFAEQNRELARQAMMDCALFDDHQYKHEYAMLVKRRLGLLTDTERNAWFAWVDAGPDMSSFDELIKSFHKRDATDEDRKDQIQHWQFKKLHLVRDYLDGERLAFYEEMFAMHGEPTLVDMDVHFETIRWGDDSPMTVDDLGKMTFEDAVEAVSTWRPDEDRSMGPNINGLASVFDQYVATKSEEFSAKAFILRERPAIYLRGFLNQMSEAVKAGCQIDVRAILDLSQWVVEQATEQQAIPTQGAADWVDSNWQWTRNGICQFIENVCAAKTEDIPKYPLKGLREPMRKLLERLCCDTSKSYVGQDISKDDPRLHDYLYLGMNSPRGKAVGAALEYACWVANHIKICDGKQDIVPDGFEAMPEVREMLAWQIASGNRTFEAMSVIGARIALIYWIDKDWLGATADQLFHLKGIEQSPQVAQGWSAWNAFLVWVRPHIEFYRLFKGQFDYAVKQAATVEITEDSLEDPMNRLGEHLMILYGRGQLGLEDDEKLLTRFLADSNPDIRRHAIGFVGQFVDGDEKIPCKEVERFKVLWDLYWAGAGKKDAENKPDALLFGTWFSSGQFPEQWALDQLEQFVEVAPTPEPDHAIVEQMAKICQTDIARTVRILDRMVRGDREGWRTHGWRESAMQILRAAKESGSPEAREVRSKLIDHLGRRGYADFGDLLSEGGS